MTIREVIPKDAIPSIDNPELGEEYFGRSDDEVIVVEWDGDVRVYSVQILHNHEIVTEVFSDESIAVT